MCVSGRPEEIFHPLHSAAAGPSHRAVPRVERTTTQYWRAAELEQILTNGTNDGSCTIQAPNTEPWRLYPVGRGVRDNWVLTEEQRWIAQGLRQAEVEAYRVSDPMDPPYLYQGHCRGF